MSLFGKIRDLFRRRPKEAPVVGEVGKAEAPQAEPAVAKKPTQPVVARKPGGERLSRVIRGTRMSEKSVRLAKQEQYVFEVRKDATRDEVRHAVETLFEEKKVKVEAVRMANVRGKAKRQGRRNDWRKAYVRLAPGQSLEGTEIGA